MTCVYEDYEVKIKIVKEQRVQLKIKFLMGCNIKVVIYWEKLTFRGGNNIWWESTGRFFSDEEWGGESR